MRITFNTGHNYRKISCKGCDESYSFTGDKFL